MGDDDAETLGNVIRGRFSFNYPEFDDVSEDARDIINKLLVTDKRSNNATFCLFTHSTRTSTWNTCQP